MRGRGLRLRPGAKNRCGAFSALHIRVHARAGGSVIPFVTWASVSWLGVCACFAAGTVPAARAGADPAISPLLHAVEQHYNHVQTLKLDFSQTYTAPGHPVQKESGTLYLRKPGRMRWDYSSPAGKLFLSDGKDVYLYNPGSQRAEKSRLKQSEDMRAPLAFLLGKLDFEKEFRDFSTRPEGAGTWITAYPKSQNLVYTKVEFLASPDGRIEKVDVTGQDHSQLDYIFSNQQLNAPAPPSLFAFHAPPGVEVVETGQ